MIALFDSGLGGLSVWSEVFKLMPNEDYLYISDSGNAPYGPRPVDYIINRAQIISRFLIERGADIIIVACNTATAAAITNLRESFDIPFIGMEPAIKPAALHSTSGVVGVLATAGTLKGRLYLNTLANFAGDIKVIERVGNGLVEAVERGDLNTPETIKILHEHIDPMVEAGADHIVLGCTHYPFLTSQIESIVPSSVEIVNPAPAVARQAQRVYRKLEVENSDGIKKCKFFTTGEFAPWIREYILSIAPNSQFININI